MNIFDKISAQKIFAIVLGLGVFLRLVRAFFVPDLDQDEALTYNEITSNSFTNLLRRSSYIDHDHPPLSNLMHKLWLQLFDSEYSLRVPSFFFRFFHS